MLAKFREYFDLNRYIYILISSTFIYIMVSHFGLIIYELKLLSVFIFLLFTSIFADFSNGYYKAMLYSGEGEKVSRDYHIFNVVLLVLYILVSLYTANQTSDFIVYFVLVMVVGEIALDVFSSDLGSNGIHAALRAAVFSFVYGSFIVYSQLPTLVNINQPFLYINISLVTNILIVSLPLFFLFVNIRVRDLIANVENDKTVNNILMATYLLLVFSIIPIILVGLLPAYMVFMILLSYPSYKFFDSRDFEFSFELSNIMYIVIFVLIVSFIWEEVACYLNKKYRFALMRTSI